MDLPGQVSYRPVDGAEAGDLCLNRITEQPPRYQQLVPFEQWFPSTKTSVALSPSNTIFQSTKSQRNWLYKTHPEALLGNLNLRSLISEETRASKAAGPDTQTGSVLAVGEIVDLRNTKSSRIAKCPVVALAAGEAGHIVQLSVINPEKWSWNDSSFALGTPQTKFQGSWCSDGSPISKLEFATKLQQYDKIRWLIAQNQNSTTIFEPELRAKPVAATISTLTWDAANADLIVMNPVVTLTTDDTGGEAHCDFSINLGSDDVSPQLAVIDRSGNWFVWHIVREGYGRGKTTKAALLRKGSSALPLSIPSGLSYQPDVYRIAWTARADRFDEWKRDSSPSVQSDPLADGVQAACLVELDVARPKHDGLLMCNHAQLQVSDVDGTRPASLLDFSKWDGVDTLLDAKTLHGSASHVLVLTTNKLYLLDVSHTVGQAMSPNVIVSCCHFRNSPRETLKMSVARLQSCKEEASSLVSIHSAQSLGVDLFWFIINRRDGTAKFHRQVVQFQGLGTANVEDRQGIESLAAVPLHSAPAKKKYREAAEEGAESFTDVQLYQLYALTTNLSLSTTIVAITHEPKRNLPDPVKSGELWWTDERRAKFLRRKWLREMEQAFVIPDQLEEVKSLSISHVPSQAGNHDIIQLRRYLVRLVQEINRGFFGDSARDPVRLSVTDFMNPVREALSGREEGEHVALQPLLGFSNLWQPLDLSTLEDEVSSSLRRFKTSRELRLFECGNYGPQQSAMDLFEKMSVSWSSILSAESLKATQWRYVELGLERMAAEVYLSQKGVYMAPQSTFDLAAKSLPQEEACMTGEEDLNSQPRSSQGMRTPSGTPSSSRATSEAFGSSQGSQEDEEPGQEDPAVARLRMYLPSIKFTPPSCKGPSRVISLWPEQRGVDPSAYRYRPPGQDCDERAEAAKRQREKQEDRRRRRAGKRAQLGIKMEGVGESFSQPYRPMISRSSPPPSWSQDAGSSQPQAESQGLGGPWGLSTSSRFASGIGSGASQTMSQPQRGEFGGILNRSKKKKAVRAGFK